jgi:hypothetical protein
VNLFLSLSSDAKNNTQKQKTKHIQAKAIIIQQTNQQTIVLHPPQNKQMQRNKRRTSNGLL